MSELKVGDKIYVAGLETEVKGFAELCESTMVETEYGNFNLDLVKKIGSKLNEEPE